jgi:spore germination protein GerM
LISGIIIFKNKKNENNEVSEYQNYIPEEEISDEQSRQTIVTLYFLNNETGEISTETRLIDAVRLLENPYEELVSMLIEGPKNEKLVNIIDEDTKINSITKEDDCVVINFSEEFLNLLNDEINKNNIINCIVNTLTELNEIDSIKILINGEENKNFNEIYMRVN